jgi:Cu(I)/Ag(I) efflux system membrane protein CusA/SilA
MLNRIIEWSVRNQFLVWAFVIATGAAGVYAFFNIPVDALPDVSDVQVIVYTEWPGQPPQIVEDQVTYPVTTRMLAVANVKVVRGYSFFGYSFVYVIFKDGTDIYWARSRVLEYLSALQGSMPQGVSPQLGPDATPVGWVYQYALVEHSGRHDLAELRTLQDWYLRYQLQTVPGVAEVASLGGFVKQYQVVLDPNKLLAYDIPLSTVISAVRHSNNDVGGRVVEYGETEHMIEGIGYVQKLSDLEDIPVGADEHGTPILIRDVGWVRLGPDMRRGAAELDNQGDVVSGIIEMRYWNNAQEVITRVKRKLEELKSSLPSGVEIVPVYDRSDLIQRAQDTLRRKLIEESVIVAAVCVIFLLHLPSSLVAILTLPLGILMAMTVMYSQGLIANIMSLGGIAIAIGAMIDGAIVMIENAHKHLERDRGKKEHWAIIVDAAKEVGPPLFFSLLIIAVGFLPVFGLTGQSGRMFRPLAFTKTYSMLAAALLSVTLVPILMGYLIRGRIRPEMENPLTRILVWTYRPVLRGALKLRWAVLVLAVVILAITVVPYYRLGSEFIPPLDEGDLLYMPSLLPGMSITEAQAVAQQTNRIIMQFPEVEHSLAKIGRSESPLDPAPIEMMETVIRLKPRSQWRTGITMDELASELNSAIRFPGVTNAFTLPIKTRIDMLSTGIKTPVGVKITGPSLDVLQKLGEQVEPILRSLPGTRSVYAERVSGGYYLDFVVKRREAARYGLTVDDVEDVVASAIGGDDVTRTVEGLERFPVNVRYGRELRYTPEELDRVLIPTPSGAEIPISQVANIFVRTGPSSIKTEGARPQAWIYVDIDPEQDVGSYVERAQQALRTQVKLPPGYTIEWSGQFEYMQEARERLKVIVPITIAIIFLLLFLNFRNLTEVLIVMLALPFALVGGIWFMYLLGYNMSVATMVGFIALAGVAAETGVVMIIYLDQAYETMRKEKGKFTASDLYDAIMHGAVERVRPKMMTVSAIIAGLLPIMWSSETGASVMKRIAAPMVGGMVSSTILTLIIIPILYELWRGYELGRNEADTTGRLNRP